MKKNYVSMIAMILLLMLSANVLLFRCERKSKLVFSGRIVDSKGNPIIGAVISQGGVKKSKNAETSRDGSFKFGVELSKRYVINITKLGFGFVSKIYADTTSNITITMTEATVVTELNPANAITVTDTTPATSEPTDPVVTHLSSPLDTIPFVYDANGRLVSFSTTTEIKNTYQAIADFAAQQAGATIEVEPDALEDPSASGATSSFFQNSNEKGNVTASLSTVDIYSPDGMPGDYSTRMGEKERGFMVTYGAADVNFYRNGKPLQLKKGKSATLTIPVDTLAILYGQKLPETMPLLVYNKETGLWEQDGNNVGILNKQRTAYVAKVTHFSVFNMDELFGAGGACIKLCSDTPPAGAKIEITGDNPGHVKYLTFGATLCAGTGGCAAGQTAYAINNLKTTTPIGVRLFDAANNCLSSYVFISGAAGNTSSCGSNYSECLATDLISWGVPCYQNADAVGSIDGPIVAILPLGGTMFRVAWVYVDPAAAGSPLANPATNYKVEFITITNQGTSIDLSDAGWTDAATVAGSTEIKNSRDVNIATGAGTDPVLIRVTAFPSGAPAFVSGSVRLLNPTTAIITGGDTFETEFNAIKAACENVGVTITP